MATRDAAKPELTKRQSPNPEPETEALRARKKLRQLDARRGLLIRTHEAKLTEIDGEENSIRDKLSIDAVQILDKLEK